MQKQIRSLKISHALLSALLAGALASCSAGSSDPMADAAAAMEQQDYRTARIHLLTALQDNARDPQANLMFARVMTELGDGLSAEAALEKLEGNKEFAEQVAPLLGRAYLLKGQNEEAMTIAGEPAGKFAADLHAVKIMALFGLDRPVEAVAELAKARSGFPDNAELLWIEGNHALELGDIDTASQSSAAALNLAPEQMEALLLAGRLSLAKADGEQALTYFDRIQELRPDNVVSLYLSGAVLRDLGKRAEARQRFDAVLRAVPEHPWATYFAAQMDYEEGNSDKASQRFQSTKADISQVPPAVRLAGLLELRRGNHEQAIDHLQRYLARNPADAETAQALSKALMAAGNEAQAFAVIQPVADTVSAPSDLLAHAANLADDVGAGDIQYNRRAKALEKQPVLNRIFAAEHAIIAQQWLQAEKQYTKLLEKEQPQQVMLLNNAAMVQLKLGRGNEAIKLAEKALELAPNDPMVQDTLGSILLQTRKDPQRALGLVRAAAAQIPASSEIRWHLAQALAANDQGEEARQIATGLSAGASPEQQEQIANLLAWI